MERHAARVGDAHRCPRCGDGKVVQTGDRTVFFGNEVAARQGDEAMCCGGRTAVVEGHRGVLIEGRPAARKGDATAGGGVVAAGLPSVVLGAGATDAGVGAEGPGTDGVMRGAAGPPEDPVTASARRHYRTQSKNCSGLVRGVANDFGVGAGLDGLANDQVAYMRSHWRLLTREEAIAHAEAGRLVVVGMRAEDHATSRTAGHVAIVTRGALYRDAYPRVWSGSNGGEAGRSEGGRSVGEIWRRSDRDRVEYFTPPATRGVGGP